MAPLSRPAAPRGSDAPRPPRPRSRRGACAPGAQAGRDGVFGRPAPSLAALGPPLYAIEIWPGLATASGGPRRDARARVLASAPAGGEPVPGPYARGAAGG